MERTHNSDGSPHTFSISFVRVNDSDNGPRGSVKYVAKAAKYTKPGKKVAQPKRLNSRPWQFKHHDAIPMQDLTTNQLITPKFTHILTYNEIKVKHYG